jgi:oxygen-dependent protoporphyrinogen oxidase
MKRIAIVGGGIAGVTAAWELARLADRGAPVEAVLFEATGRLGGIVETVRQGGFTLECGADGWVTEKPWARELAEELGLGGELIASQDETRKTYVLLDGALVAMPDGMRMMVPVDMAALEVSTLFSEAAKAAYRAEIARADALKASAPEADESVASFVRRHFGAEVLEKIGAPLLSGVFGGDVETLSVRAVMGPFVAMEREHGSLILALQQRAAAGAGRRPATVFTSLRCGGESLIEAMVAAIPPDWLRLECPVLEVARGGGGWRVRTAVGWEDFDGLMMAAPVEVTRRLLAAELGEAAQRMAMEASSAVVAGFAFAEGFDLPQGFGFLVPPTRGSESALLAGTFVDQKFSDRAPEGTRVLRGFFGGAAADRLMNATDATIAALALAEFEKVLGLKLPESVLTVVRRWPRSLPQYAVGHLERMVELFARVRELGGLWLLGNGYRGVGLPDLVRDARSAAREAAELWKT